jgi:hypothetical protein
VNTTKTLNQLLEDKEACFPEITSLYNWSLNYEAGKTPFTLLIDLIGYTADNYGESLFNIAKVPLGYLELDYLADALKEYATIGQDAYNYIVEILDAESAE